MVNEKVSVIVPIYNVEPYLERCIDSILRQSYQNMEVILIDDGSTDACPVICDKYAEKYRQIQVIHKENEGLSSARNAGLDVSTGDLVMFVDSDDFVEADFVEKLYYALNKYEADVAICNFQYVDENGKKVIRYPDNVIQNECINNIQYWNRVFQKYGHFYVTVWNKLYRRELWDSCRYPLGKINEDEYILHNIINQYTRIACMDYIGYNYVQRGNSIMANKRKKANFDLFEAWLKRIDYFKSIGRRDFVRKQLSKYLEKLLFLYELCVTEEDKKKYCIYYNKYIDVYKYLLSMGEQIPIKEHIKRIGGAKNPILMGKALQIYTSFWNKLHKEAYENKTC